MYPNTLNHMKILNSFPDAWITYKILQTIYVILISGYVKIKFSKLKLIKSYLK